MTVGLIALGVVAVVGLALAVLAYRQGRNSERGRAAEQESRVKDEQLEVATRRPRTRRALIDLLRKGRF